MSQTPNSKTPNTATTTETATPVAATPAASPALSVLPPAQGGSYLVDEKTGEHTLTERTQESIKE